MEDVKLIIKIPEDYYNYIKNISDYHCTADMLIIKNGTPLDLEGLKSDMKALNCGFPYGLDYLLGCLEKRLGITIADIDKEDN